MSIEADYAACKAEAKRLYNVLAGYRRCSDMALLHPDVIDKFQSLNHFLTEAYRKGLTETLFRPFETYRSPIRQAELIKQKPNVTKAPPYSSAHQYGLAVDFVPIVNGNWNWHDANDYEFLAKSCATYGLSVPYTWDKVHVEHPLFREVRRVLI